MLQCQHAMKQTISYDHKNNKVITGYTDFNQLRSDTCFYWFNEYYDNYKIDTLTTEAIHAIPFEYDIVVLLGTWCSDTKQQLPALYKIIERVNFPEKKIKLIGVNRDKKGMHNESELFQLDRVPTIIFIKGKKEIGRITETPQLSLEKDWLQIIQATTY